jgi:hypothetical protein
MSDAPIALNIILGFHSMPGLHRECTDMPEPAAKCRFGSVIANLQSTEIYLPLTPRRHLRRLQRLHRALCREAASVPPIGLLAMLNDVQRFNNYAD